MVTFPQVRQQPVNASFHIHPKADLPVRKSFSTIRTDYYKDLKSFLACIEETATTFRPHGDLIHSYTRPSPNAAGKGKGIDITSLSPESDDAIVYEVYHVRCPLTRNVEVAECLYAIRLHGKHLVSKNITAACSCLFCFTSKRVPT